MRKAKMTDEQLQADLESGLAKKDIAAKYGLTRNALYIKLSRLRANLKETKPNASEDPLTDCFAYNRFMGTCTCLTFPRCQGSGCAFYKTASNALEEAMRGVGTDNAYAKTAKEVVKMIEENQRE